MIDVRKINKTFHVPHEIKALVEVSTKIDPAEVVVVCGPSGSGKSTFLRCLNRLEKADTGHIFIDGIDVPLGVSSDPNTEGVALVDELHQVRCMGQAGRMGFEPFFARGVSANSKDALYAKILVAVQYRNNVFRTEPETCKVCEDFQPFPGQKLLDELTRAFTR